MKALRSTKKDQQLEADNVTEQASQSLTEELRQAKESLRQSEERFRDLFDEAPIAYVHEGLDSRIIQANRTAMRILGLKPEEVAGTFGESLVDDSRRDRTPRYWWVSTTLSRRLQVDDSAF